MTVRTLFLHLGDIKSETCSFQGHHGKGEEADLMH